MDNLPKPFIAPSLEWILKIVVGLYILYRTCLVEIGISVTGLNYVIWGASLILTILLDGGELFSNRYVLGSLVLIGVTTVTSFVTAKDTGISMQITLRLVESVVFGYVVIRMAAREGDVKAVAWAWVTSAVILVAYAALRGTELRSTGRVSVNETLNVNTLGVFLMFAVWFAAYLFSHAKPSFLSLAMLAGSAAVFAYGILLTGSRKALLGAAVIILLWAVFHLRKALSVLSPEQKGVLIIGTIAAVALFVWYGLPFFRSAAETLIYRMQFLFTEGVNAGGRNDLIVDSLKVFRKHPVFGVGWNNYRFYSFNGKYSHCTYTEILACCGVVGGVLGLYLWIVNIRNSFRMAENGAKDKRLTLLLLAVLFYICWGQILWYNVNLLLIMNVIAAMILCTQSAERDSFS